MSMPSVRLLAALAMMGALSACNTPQATAPQAASYAASAAPRLDEDSASGPGACGEQIGYLRKVINSDLQTGNLEQKVYDRMSPEVSKAAETCRAGKDGEARAMLAATKARYGYR